VTGPHYGHGQNKTMPHSEVELGDNPLVAFYAEPQLVKKQVANSTA